MKKIENCIIGESAKLMDYTNGWYTVHVHPTTYYRRMSQFQNSLSSIDGLYAEIDYGSGVYLRFSNQSDAEKFRLDNHAYL